MPDFHKKAQIDVLKDVIEHLNQALEACHKALEAAERDTADGKVTLDRPRLH